MNQKILIVLFVTIFYNGVVYAAPATEHNPEVVLPQQKLTTVSPVVSDHLNKKVEQSPIPTAFSSAPVSQKPSAEFSHTEVEVDKITSAPLDSLSQGTPVAPQEFTPTNVTHNLTNKNATSVIENKNSTVIAESKNISQPVYNNKSVTPNKNTSAPVEVLPSANSSVSDIGQALQNSTVPTNVSVSTTTAPKIINTSAHPEEVTTASPNSTNSEKVVVHHIHTPVEEKHFDGPSFIGGMILTIGLTAIGFIAFKYYKSGKIDMNYRTL